MSDLSDEKTWGHEALKILLEELKKEGQKVHQRPKVYEDYQFDGTFSVCFTLKDEELSFTMDTLKKRYIEPAMRELVETITFPKRNVMCFHQLRSDGSGRFDTLGCRVSTFSFEGVVIRVQLSYNSKVAGTDCTFSVLTSSY